MTGLTYQLASLILEVLGILVAIGIVWGLLASQGARRPDVRPVAAGVLGAVAVALAVAGLADASFELNQQRGNSVDARAGIERCFDESGVGSLLPYIHWVRGQLPAHAVYALAPYAGQPDVWCMTLVLLPALPAGPGGRADWIVTFGTIPPGLQARIARHDPSVQVFASGFAIAPVATR
jgi:hypothetical protein